jgi:DNA-binding NarL/FixJ family response regulator
LWYAGRVKNSQWRGKHAQLSKTKRILIIASPGRLRDALCVLLRANSQATIEPANDGQGGLQNIAQHVPNLVLLDMSLPSDQAWWVLEQLKSNWPEAPCLALTHTHDQERRARAAGADYVLQIGFPAEELFEILEAAGREEKIRKT